MTGIESLIHAESLMIDIDPLIVVVLKYLIHMDVIESMIDEKIEKTHIESLRLGFEVNNLLVGL